MVDAIFDPLAARQVLNSRHWDVQAAKNDALLRTADAYFQVHRHRGTYAGALYAAGRGRDLVARVEALSKDLVPRVEVDRARNMLAELEQRAASARQGWREQSASLTQVLRLDPRAVVEPLEHDHTQVTLLDPGRGLDDLMAVALTNRPELASRQAMVKASVEMIRREKARPFTPNILLNGFQTPNEMIQAGIFGLGPNSSLNQWVGRDDFSIQPMWQLDAFGIGNLARIKGQRAGQSMAIIDFYKAQDAVAADVTRAQARLQSAAVRVFQADRALRTGIITFNGSYEGLQQTSRFGNVLVLVNRPQEAVFALQLLYTAFEEYFSTVADYNFSQFELFHALGYPARELACLRPPRRGRARGHGSAGLPAAGRRRAAPGLAMSADLPRTTTLLSETRRSLRGLTHAGTPDQDIPTGPRAVGRETAAQRLRVDGTPRATGRRRVDRAPRPAIRLDRLGGNRCREAGLRLSGVPDHQSQHPQQ